MNFEPSRSEGERDEQLARGNQTSCDPSGNEKNAESDGSSRARETDKGCVFFPQQWPDIIPAVITLCPHFFTGVAVCLVI